MRGTTDPAEGGLRTPSLRRRVTLVVLALIAVMLIVLAVITDVVLANRLDAQLRQRLVDRAGVATALVDRVDPRDLARRLEGEGVSVVLTETNGTVYAEGPLAGRASSPGTSGSSGSSGGSPPGNATPGSPAPEPPASGGPTPGGPAPIPRTSKVVQRGDLLSVTRRLGDGSTLEVIADARDIGTTLDQVRLALALAALLVLVVAGIAVPLVVDRALRPLGRITQVARTITRGDRARRLDPTHPRSELGRTATAFDEMLDEITGAEQRAVESEDRLRGFLSDAAHDLRTPLTGVLAAAEHVLRDDPDRPAREEVLVTLIREARRAGRLVDDMLLMASIERGLDISPSEVDLREIADRVVAARTLVDTGVRLEVEGPPAPVWGDADRLTRVVGNLVQNATESGAQLVTLTTAVDGEHTRLDVDDDGPGVPLEQRERVFERMVRLDGARAHGGSGLGLSIARGIAVAHHGTLVSLEHAPRGARFRLTLPGVRR